MTLRYGALLLAALAAPVFAADKPADAPIVQTASGLRYQVLAPGDGGAKPTDSDVTLVNYEGKLVDGTTFDKSSEPMPMPVAAVVPGFAEALKLMPRGAKYRFWIPPALGYGADAQTDPDGKVVIPANATLVFDVELLDFITQEQFQQLIQQQQAGAAGAQPAQP